MDKSELYTVRIEKTPAQDGETDQRYVGHDSKAKIELKE